MNRRVLIFSFIGILIVLLGLTTYYYSDSLTTRIDSLLVRLFKTKTYSANNIDLTIVNTSKFAKVTINDEKKLEQVLRRYEPLFPTFKSVELTIVDTPQDLHFSWESGTAFSYSLDPLPNPILEITIQINTPLIEKYNWSDDQISKETEYILLNALERSLINLDPVKANTHSDAEEAEKSALIEERALKALEELDRDNDILLLKVE